MGRTAPYGTQRSPWTASLLATGIVALATACGGGASSGATSTASASTYTISGTVSGGVASGVTLTLSGASSATKTTGSSGTYTFSGLSAGSYTVAPHTHRVYLQPHKLIDHPLQRRRDRHRLHQFRFDLHPRRQNRLLLGLAHVRRHVLGEHGGCLRAVLQLQFDHRRHPGHQGGPRWKPDPQQFQSHQERQYDGSGEQRVLRVQRRGARLLFQFRQQLCGDEQDHHRNPDGLHHQHRRIRGQRGLCLWRGRDGQP